ncbi:DUS18 phosphatase, partial [Nothoprocta ornata]|nr:DUS18 phosphatase [Nothoprocta pentlandii]NWY04206.1 DUS18 phosphatase [Nothoprocta ornata]
IPRTSMNAAFRVLPMLFQNPSVYGLSRITPHLYLSDGAAANNKVLLLANHITTVVNVAVEVVNTIYPNIEYLCIPVVDSPVCWIYGCFDPVADKIHSVSLRQGRTLLHCAAGVSRSAAVCLAYLMKYQSVSLASAHKWVKACRPIIRPNNGFWQQLIQYEHKLYGTNTVRMINTPLGTVPDVYGREVRVTLPF